MTDNPEDRNRRNEDRFPGGWWGAAAAAAGVVAATGGLIYALSGRQGAAAAHGERPPETSSHRTTEAENANRASRSSTSSNSDSRSSVGTVTSLLDGLWQRIGYRNSENAHDAVVIQCPRGLRERAPASSVTNLNSLLSDIYVRYVAFTKEQFQLSYAVLNTVFLTMHAKMKAIDPYYNRYSSNIQIAGSNFDRLKISQPDEFDMDIAIDLPLNTRVHSDPTESDIIIEPKAPGFVQLKMGVQYQRLPYRDGIDWQIHKIAYEWGDERHYLQRSKFIDWFKGLVDKALESFPRNINGMPTCAVMGQTYVIHKSESGPAITLKIKDASGNAILDVDLVPALKFPENRWPVSRAYRSVPAQCQQEHWLVVPKPNKMAAEPDTSRSWRVGLHTQERALMYNLNNLKQTIRLIKKFRDAQGLKKICSYYIKTIFFWEILERDKDFWDRNNQAALFKIMMKKLHDALVRQNIPYFWNKDNNLIGQVGSSTLNVYAMKVQKLLTVLEDPDRYREVAKYLLTPDEYEKYSVLNGF